MRLFARAALAFALLLTQAHAAAAQGLSRVERRMTAAVEAENARSVALLQQLVEVNSGTLNLAGVEQVGRMMRAELEPLGFEVRWIPQAEVQRAGHLVATHKGSGRGRRMLLIGHLDTVFELDSPFQKWTRRGDIAEGPGTSDMKGGLVVMLSALKAMQTAGVLKDADITIVLTGDEERVGRPHSISRADLLAAARVSDVALEFEGLADVDGRDHGSIARRSSSGWTLTVTGKQAAQTEGEGRRFIHRGIAGRAFERRFALADHLVVQGARIENGLLHVALKREVPEALKPRRIAIEAGQPRPVLTQQAA